MLRAIADSMQAAAISAGDRYLAAQHVLDADFRAGTLTAENLPDRVAEVSRLEGEPAAVHLASHLQTAAVLTPGQVEAYNQAR